METPGLKVPRSIGIEDRELFPRAPESTELLKDTVAPGTGLRGNQTRGLKGRGSDLLDLFWIPGPGGRWPWSIPLVPTPHSPPPFLAAPAPVPAPGWSGVEFGFRARMCLCSGQHSPPRAPRLPAGLATGSPTAIVCTPSSGTLSRARGSRPFEVSPDPLKCSPQGGRGRFLSEKCGITELIQRDSPRDTSHFRKGSIGFYQLTLQLSFFSLLSWSREWWGWKLSVAHILALKHLSSGEREVLHPHPTALVLILGSQSYPFS